MIVVAIIVAVVAVAAPVATGDERLVGQHCLQLADTQQVVGLVAGTTATGAAAVGDGRVVVVATAATTSDTVAMVMVMVVD